MKPTICLSILAAALLGLVAQGQTPNPPAGSPAIGGGNVPAAADSEFQSDFPPRKFDPRRYDAIFRRNPFMQEVVPSKGPVAEDPWADGLELRAVTRIGGKFVVHVENTKLAKDEDREKRRMAYHRLVEGDDREALRIQTVKAHRDPSQVEVVVATGVGTRAKTATIKYSDKQLKAKAPKTVKPPKPGQPTTTRRTVTPRPTTPTTRRPTATPGKRRVILPPGLPGSTQR